MQIMKLLPAACAVVFCASFISVRADDTPVQSAARAALEQKMNDLDKSQTQAPPAQAGKPATNANQTISAKAVTPQAPAAVAPAATAPTVVAPAPAAPAVAAPVIAAPVVAKPNPPAEPAPPPSPTSGRKYTGDTGNNRGTPASGSTRNG
jgi:hypothetical protein